MKKRNIYYYISFIALLFSSCAENTDEFLEYEDLNFNSDTNKKNYIEYKGLKVNHRFNTPITDLNLEMDEPGLINMYNNVNELSHLSLKKLSKKKSTQLSTLPSDEIIAEATEEVIELFPYKINRENQFKERSIHKLLDTLPIEVKITLLKDKTISSLLKKENDELNSYLVDYEKNKTKELARVNKMIKNDFVNLNDNDIINNIEIIDEYYKKNMNYEILKKTIENRNRRRAKSVDDIYDHASNGVCVAQKSKTVSLVDILTIKDAAEDADRIANENFSSSMSRSNTRKDAMRHIMWNILLSKYYVTLTASRKKRTDFAERVANAHEECGNNLPDSKQMDYHNNAIGREIYWDKTGIKKNFLGIKYAVDEASTEVYKNEALDRVNNKSCYIVKEKDDKLFPERLLKNSKTPEQIRDIIIRTDKKTVVYINGPVANSLDLSLGELSNIDVNGYTFLDTKDCVTNGVPKPWIEDKIVEYPFGITNAYPYLRKYLDYDSGKILIPVQDYKPCVKKKFLETECYKL